MDGAMKPLTRLVSHRLDSYRERCRLLEERVKLLEIQLAKANERIDELELTPEYRRKLAKEIGL